MTQEEIIEMAIQAELNLYVHDLTEKQYIEVVKTFAKLVAAKALAQRTWAGLTNEDISEIVRGTHNTGSFVRAIEAKLKQKNGYADSD
jgi:hypothetical protein